MLTASKWIIALALAGYCGAASAQITYNVDFLINSFPNENELILGTITTDGQTADPLTAADITSWSLYSVSGPTPFSYSGGPGTVTLISASGVGPLTATAQSLTYNFTENASIEFGSGIALGAIPTSNGDDSYVIVNSGNTSVQYNVLPSPTVIATAALAAPEIEPSSAISGFSLLLGGLMALRGRRTAGTAETH